METIVLKHGTGSSDIAETLTLRLFLCLWQISVKSWLFVTRKDVRPAASAKTQTEQICRAPRLQIHPSLSHPPNLSAPLPRPLHPVSDEVNRTF